MSKPSHKHTKLCLDATPLPAPRGHAVLRLPHDVLSHIFSLTRSLKPSTIHSIARVNRTWRRVALELLYRRVQLESCARVASFARVVATRSTIVRELVIEIPIKDLLQGSKSSATPQAKALKKILHASSEISSLSLSFHPQNETNPLRSLDLESSFPVLAHLTQFTFGNEIWLNQLSTLFEQFPKLRELKLMDLRGDLNSHAHLTGGTSKRGLCLGLEHLEVKSNTLSASQIVWLLGERELRYLEIALPGVGKDTEVIFEAIERVSSSLVVLHLSHRFKSLRPTPTTPPILQQNPSPTPQPSSKLYPILKSCATTLESLLLLQDFVTCSSEMIEILKLPLKKLQRLVICENLTGGIKGGLMKGLEVEGVLPGLGEVVVRGGKKGKEEKKGSGLGKSLKEKGIKWSFE